MGILYLAMLWYVIGWLILLVLISSGYATKVTLDGLTRFRGPGAYGQRVILIWLFPPLWTIVCLLCWFDRNAGKWDWLTFPFEYWKEVVKG